MASELEQDLSNRVVSCGLRYGINYLLGYLLLLVGVGASSWVTIAVAAGKQSAILNSVLAALPGITVMVLSTFKFLDRADWWNDKRRKLDSLYRGLRDEHRQVDEVSKELTVFLEEHNAKWPSFGRPPGG